MLKKALLAIITLGFFIGISLKQEDKSMYLILNMENKPELPKDFRIIPDLHASGGGQFSEESLKKVLEKLPSTHVRIIDLREESHGFLNGIAISWYAEYNTGNLGKSLEDILQDEHMRLDDLSKQKTIKVYTREYVPFSVDVHHVESEQELTARYGLGYRRFPVTDHRRPKDDVVQSYIDMIKELPEDTWLHIHCLAGRGRTTSFLAILDMMRNANKMSLETIATRQENFGGLNILKPASETVWKYPYILERIEFFKLFYKYCHEVPKFDVPWTVWVEQHHQKRT